MRVEFKKSFLKELQKLRNKGLKNSIAECIEQVESAKSINQIRNVKKLASFDDFYRIRIGDYRMGVKIEEDTVYFVVFEHRKDIYKKFP